MVKLIYINIYIPEMYMRIVLPKGAGMQEISFLCEEIRTLILLILLSINVRV